jgi:hypothetical protein
MTNEQVMKIMEELGLHEGGVENWVPNNAWVKVANAAAAEECKLIEQRIHKLDITLHTRLYVINHAICARGQS